MHLAITAVLEFFIFFVPHQKRVNPLVPCPINPLTPISDQNRTSPYNINTESSRQVRRIKKKTKLGEYKLIQYQIFQIEIMSILWQTVGRITNEILGVIGLNPLPTCTPDRSSKVIDRYFYDVLFNWL